MLQGEVLVYRTVMIPPVQLEIFVRRNPTSEVSLGVTGNIHQLSLTGPDRLVDKIEMELSIGRGLFSLSQMKISNVKLKLRKAPMLRFVYWEMINSYKRSET